MKVGYTAEEAVIGSLLVDSMYSLPKLEGILNPEHFSDYSLANIYQLALKLKKEGQPIDIVTVISKADSSYSPKLINICDGFPGASSVEYYRDLIIRNYHKRKLKEHMANGINEPTQETIKKIQCEWDGLQSLGVRKFDITDKMISYAEILEKRSKGEETFYPTGFSTLDYKVPLLKRGELCVVGARTSQGKTALLLSMALKMAKSGLRTVFCSGEMSFYQMMDRIISIETGFPLIDIRKGKLTTEHWPKITNILGVMADNKNLRFIEASALTFEKIMPEVIGFKPDVLLVDYVQRFMPQGRIDSRAAFYSDIANLLKGLSVEKNMVVIAASQLGRGVEQRKDEPRLSDLKESGGLEEAADVVWLLHNKDADIAIKPIREYKMLISKNRNGPVFSFDAVFETERAMFYETEK